MAKARTSIKPTSKSKTAESSAKESGAARNGSSKKPKQPTLQVKKKGANGNGKALARRRALPGELAARRAATAASRVVEQAASILEEEIARGIVTAKQVEKRYVDVPALRSADSADVMQRFRKDAHELVDILIDLVHATARSVNRAISIEAAPPRALPEQVNGTNGGRSVTSIEMPGPISPGQSTEVQFTLTNTDDTATPLFTFYTLGLVNSKGDSIASDCIKLSPKRISIPPKGSAPLKVKVKTPEGISSGLYTGVLQSSHLDKLNATLSVEVA